MKCLHCQAKLKAKDDLAGRNVRCPRCKTVVGIPQLATDGVTLPPHPGAVVSDDVTAAPSSASISSQEESLATAGHLRIQTEIARGGMGAIMRAVDEDIQREVAVKFLLNAANEKQRARFVEEAQITGQLEHPNIVPIHQLGVHEDGRCFFSMKMVKGRSLAEILKDEHNGYTLTQLLNVFVNICNAMAYAHSRKVIHRDLKPANVMVGDFGEVYVMDWGLAKVLGAPSEDEASARHVAKSLADASASDKSIATSRASAGDLTQAGAIMGTLAYMPPEQATGAAVDERADIYSLGAILYEIMTLTPPPNRGGDMMALLMRVIEGKIDSPEERAPERMKSGWITPELSAIAMKALAKTPWDRFQTVDSLRRDIELFLDGRSVSAKRDSAWEMVKKLMKRNKGTSIATAVSLLVLLVVGSYFLKVNHDANTAYRAEQEDKEKRTREAVPALIQAARLNIERLDPSQAMKQVDLALLYAPSDVEARLLKAQLLIAGKHFVEGLRELDAYLEVRPQDGEANRLREFCTAAEPNETANVLQITALFARQKLGGLAEVMLKEFGPNVAAARKQLLERYRAQIEKGWPGLGSGLTLNNSGLFHLELAGAKPIGTLEPLRGIPISTIRLKSTRFSVNDLTPLRGMPLTSLEILHGNELRDLEPLRGMPLEALAINAAVFLDDLSPLEGMPLTSLSLRGCTNVADLTPLQGMPLKTLDLSSTQKAVDFTPLKGTKLISVQFYRPAVSNRASMATLREIPTLKSIAVTGLSAAMPSNEFWRRYDAGEFEKSK